MLAYCLAIYLLLETANPRYGLVGYTFLVLLPSVVAAFVSYVADPWRERSLTAYLLVPFWILLVAMPFSIIFLREGTICVVILSPIWLIAGMVGTGVTYAIRHRIDNGRRYCTTLAVIPLAMMVLEPAIPVPTAEYTVTRNIIVNADTETIWPLLEGTGDIKPGEGALNFSQDVIGVPRPVGAQLIGEGIGADRHATWTFGIEFREQITEWRPGQRIGWRFLFDNVDGWQFTDTHLMPDSAYYHVTRGGYTMKPLGPERTLLQIDTTYWVRTPVNGYSAMWGEVFLGDLENNLLVLIKQRAEKIRA
jgi:hypothetical protein